MSKFGETNKLTHRGALARGFGHHGVPLLAAVRGRRVGDGRRRRHAHPVNRGGRGAVGPGP